MPTTFKTTEAIKAHAPNPPNPYYSISFPYQGHATTLIPRSSISIIFPNVKGPPA